jgi:hypothetical protein
MKTFKEFVELAEEGMGAGGVPANNIANSGATAIAKYSPVMKFKMFRRKPVIKGVKS